MRNNTDSVDTNLLIIHTKRHRRKVYGVFPWHFFKGLNKKRIKKGRKFTVFLPVCNKAEVSNNFSCVKVHS